MMGIKSIKTSAYHPQTDGMVERFNGTLKTGIRRYIAQYGEEWDKALPLPTGKPPTPPQGFPPLS